MITYTALMLLLLLPVATFIAAVGVFSLCHKLLAKTLRQTISQRHVSTRMRSHLVTH